MATLLDLWFSHSRFWKLNLRTLFVLKWTPGTADLIPADDVGELLKRNLNGLFAETLIHRLFPDVSLGEDGLKLRVLASCFFYVLNLSFVLVIIFRMISRVDIGYGIGRVLYIKSETDSPLIRNWRLKQILLRLLLLFDVKYSVNASCTFAYVFSTVPKVA